jgi:hypothetical protein
MRSKIGHNSLNSLNSLRAEVVTTMDQLVQVFALRSLGYIEDTVMPFDHAYDGNDLQATHILVYDGDEPVGAMRIRWFNDFAKMERTVFRKTHRGIPNLKILLDFAFSHIARKGYAIAITHASPLYARLWRTHFGFKSTAKQPAHYHDEIYHELVKHLEVPSNAIKPETDAKVLYRVEGRWDVPAKYEGP